MANAPSGRDGVQLNSARSALLTLLSVYVYPVPKPVPTSAFIYVMGLLAFGANATRQALQRNAAAGWIEASKQGRRAVWRLTPAGYELMDEGAARLARLSRADRQWDGRVLILTAEVPENDRAVRHKLRTRLAWLGFGAIAPGVWISMRTATEPAVGKLLDRIGLGCNSYIARAGALGDIRDVVGRAWDLAALRAQYQSFLDEFADASPAEGDDQVVRLTQLVHQWRRFPFIDPGLPVELFPDDWPGLRASRLFTSLQAIWTPSALAHWSDIAQR